MLSTPAGDLSPGALAELVPGPVARPALRRDHVLWAMLGASLLLKLALAILVDGHQPVLDEVAYLGLARTLAGEGRFTGTFRPPLYPAFMALFLVTGLGTLGVRVAQALVSTVSAALVYRIAGRLFDRRTARIGAALFAFNPVLIAFSHRLWSETLFILLLLVALDLLVTAARSRGRLPWLVAGATLGLAGLARPLILTFVPLLLPWAVLQLVRWRRVAGAPPLARPWLEATLRFALLAAAAGAVVLPWTVRNYVTTGGVILVDANGPFNFLVGTQPEAAFVDKDDMWSERFARVDGRRYEDYVLVNPLHAQELALATAKRNIREHPGLYLRKSLWEAGHLWTVDSFLLRHVRNGWYGSLVPAWSVPFITIGAAGFVALLVLFGLGGLLAMPTSPFRGLALLLLAHSTLLFGLTYSLSRYALPLHAVLTFGAAMVLASPHAAARGLRRSPGGAARALTLAAALLFVGVAWTRDLPLLHDMIATGGSNHHFRMERIEPRAGGPRDQAAASPQSSLPPGIRGD